MLNVSPRSVDALPLIKAEGKKDSLDQHQNLGGSCAEPPKFTPRLGKSLDVGRIPKCDNVTESTN
jgi:hypothetical protein